MKVDVITLLGAYTVAVSIVAVYIMKRQAERALLKAARAEAKWSVMKETAEAFAKVSPSFAAVYENMAVLDDCQEREAAKDGR